MKGRRPSHPEPVKDDGRSGPPLILWLLLSQRIPLIDALFRTKRR